MKCRHVVAILIDGRREFVPCGRCNYCLQARRAEWSFRLRQELKVSSASHFITLTYEKTPLTDSGVETLRKKDLQDFIKRLRKLSPDKVRYYAVGEYGTNFERPHYHAVLFNVPRSILSAHLVTVWGHGHVDIRDLNDACIHYVSKFHLNKFGEQAGGRAPPFAVMSRRPGLGSNYVESHKEWHLNDLRCYTQVNGVMGRLPRFYVDRFFTKEQKEVIRSKGESEKVAYYEEIERLRAFVDNPEEHYLERFIYAEKVIKHKGKSNKF